METKTKDTYFTLRLDKEMSNSLDMLAQKTDRSRSAVVRLLIREAAIALLGEKIAETENESANDPH
jgi:predicted transcriptional regulator